MYEHKIFTQGCIWVSLANSSRFWSLTSLDVGRASTPSIRFVALSLTHANGALIQYAQMGVELGKLLAKKILSQLGSADKVVGHDSSTEGLIKAYISKRPASL